jgi:hypothetical protein
MLIVTVFNYPDNENYNVMCSAWMHQVRKYFPDNDILILKEKPLSSYLELKCLGLDIKSETKVRNTDISFAGHPDERKASHNVLFKLHNLCLIDRPFIFIDADAFIIHEPNALIRASAQKPFIAVNHQIIPGQTDHLSEPVLNSGMMVVSDQSLFSWDSFISILLRDRRFVHPGTDQSLINSFFKEADYDYTHDDVGYEWNSWARYTVFNGENAFCKGLPVEHPVYLNHYWNDAKPWNIDCPIFKKYREMYVRETRA